jgi:hypothetical protein
MKKDDKFLLIALSALLLLHLSWSLIPEVTIVTNILILIGAVYVIRGALNRDMSKRFKSDEESDKTKKND